MTDPIEGKEHFALHMLLLNDFSVVLLSTFCGQQWVWTFHPGILFFIFPKTHSCDCDIILYQQKSWNHSIITNGCNTEYSTHYTIILHIIIIESYGYCSPGEEELLTQCLLDVIKTKLETLLAIHVTSSTAALYNSVIFKLVQPTSTNPGRSAEISSMNAK